MTETWSGRPGGETGRPIEQSGSSTNSIGRQTHEQEERDPHAHLETALDFRRHGIAAVPVAADGSKRPGLKSWKQYQKQLPDPSDFPAWFGGAAGIGIITGAVSGGLEMAELEGRTGGKQAVLELTEIAHGIGAGDIWKRVCNGWVEQSPSGGIHWFYRITDAPAPGNQKLAKLDPRTVLAETRGEGGFVVTAPSSGPVHETGKPWERLTGGPATVPELTMEERDAFLDVLRTLDRTPKQGEGLDGFINTPSYEPSWSLHGGISPLDDYEAKTDWADILDGWTLVYTDDGTRYWRRPGKRLGISATTGRERDRDRLYVFTTSTEFQPETPYTKPGAYALLHHGGDHKAAATHLASLGYGTVAASQSLNPTPSERASQHEQAIEAQAEILRIRREATERVNAEYTETTSEALHRLTDGGAFIFDVPDTIPAIWGRGTDILWAQGEALMIVGPPGVGKTTLTGQLVRARLGLTTSVLGYPVTPSSGKVLYLAMDRPSQIRRSLHRHFHPDERSTVTERLTVWQGPPPADLAKETHILTDLCREAGADTVVIDSLKDGAIGLSEDAVGAGYNRARQSAIANGIEVLELHHQVKNGPNGTKPKSLASVFGSAWITSGAGSVILLWGEAGDPIIELRHLKQPADSIGPIKVLHDHEHGTSTVYEQCDPVQLTKAAGERGITTRDYAEAIYGKTPTSAEMEKARRRLNKESKPGGQLTKVAIGDDGRDTAVYRWNPTPDPTHPF